MQYPDAITNFEWDVIKNDFSLTYTQGGRPLKQSKPDYFNAIFMYYGRVANGVIYRNETKFK